MIEAGDRDLKGLLEQTGARHDVLLTIAREAGIAHRKEGVRWVFSADSARELLRRWRKVHKVHFKARGPQSNPRRRRAENPG